jgi:hypothetical protein
MSGEVGIEISTGIREIRVHDVQGVHERAEGEVTGGKANQHEHNSRATRRRVKRGARVLYGYYMGLVETEHMDTGRRQRDDGCML